MNQPSLFESNSPETEKVILFGLGEFQSRKKILAERELPLDRLRGAFKRASERFEIAELTDRNIVSCLAELGAKIVQVPSFVAKHPFRVTVSSELAKKSLELFNFEIEKHNQR